MMIKALIVVDVQFDFLPGGALGVTGGDEIIEPIVSQMNSSRYDVVVLSQDFHPKGHISFASRHGVEPFTSIELDNPVRIQELWPDHCVQGTKGAAIHPQIKKQGVVTAVVQKGTDVDQEAYSAFQTALIPAIGLNLAQLLRNYGVNSVDVVGLAFDYCVEQTAIDAADYGFQTEVLKNLTRSVFPKNDQDVQALLDVAGVTVV